MRLSKNIFFAIVFLIIIVPLGFYSKLYSGVGEQFINNKLSGVFYEVFWCLVFYILFPKSKSIKIVIWVFVFTCLLEFVQLVNADYLDLIRSNFIGQTIIGSSFSWSDFPFYILGSVIAYPILQFLNKYR